MSAQDVPCAALKCSVHITRGAVGGGGDQYRGHLFFLGSLTDCSGLAEKPVKISSAI